MHNTGPSQSTPVITVTDSDLDPLPEPGPEPPVASPPPYSPMLTHGFGLDVSPEPSTTPTHVDPEITVGNNNSRYAQSHLRLNNSLHDIELNRYLDLPSIVVIGSQSSGKSSLIQAISGIPLLKAPGDAYAPLSAASRVEMGHGHAKAFWRPHHGQGLLEDRIKRAQLAILNPKTPRSRSWIATPSRAAMSYRSLQISEISFVDLPGLIHNVGTSGDRENIRLIKNLASSYVSKKNSIILVTITCETDFANQGAYDLARAHDPQGMRTVGVLTKPDRSPEAAHGKWVRYISDETEPLHHGWFCVKQPDTQCQHPVSRQADAREEEDCYFKKISTWRDLPRRFQNRLGTKKLVQHLEEILSNLMSASVPELGTQIRDLIESTSQELADLGKRPSDDSVGEINSLIDQLVRDIESGVERKSRKDDNVLYRIEDEAVKFKNELRATCPEFRAWSKGLKETPSVKPLPDLFLEVDAPPATSVNREVIFLDEVLDKKAHSSVRGLPDGGQNDMAEDYLRSFTAKWDKPTNKFVKDSGYHLQDFIQKVIDARCGKLSHTGLPRHLRDTIQVHLEECLANTRNATTLLLKLERTGHTRNERYYRECKDKFLSHLKMQRELAAKNPVLRDLHRLTSPNGVQPTTSFVSAISQAKSSLSKAGFPAIEDEALARLLPPHRTDPALEDMAKASAGFEVALHRFVDYVPLAVDTELVRGLCQDLAPALRQSFKFTQPNLVERCREFLQETPDTQRDREFLEQKLRRLSLAEEELRNFWVQEVPSRD
ncbi:P-loop containing nucleoside triphosphate hydrolase protein [Lactarius quietus]|nr:P-loop containing nucleoside triphosphate hydrolase protein [Lactarius quietus]